MYPISPPKTTTSTPILPISSPKTTTSIPSSPPSSPSSSTSPPTHPSTSPPSPEPQSPLPFSSPPSNEIQSDIPRLRATHTTLGYRDGISFAKSSPSTAQHGFDAGFPVGAELGLRVGWILGGLGGLAGRVKGGENGEAGGKGEGEDMYGELERAREELRVERLLGEVERLGGGGDGNGGMDEERQLGYGWVDEIPVVRKWMRVLEERGVRAGVDLKYEREVERHAVA